jgi:hypothetical protein
MTSKDYSGSERRGQAGRQHSRLFTVRIWTEEVAGGREYRGIVQEVTSRTTRSFRNWSDLTGFIIARMDGEDRSEEGRMEGETSWAREHQQ